MSLNPIHKGKRGEKEFCKWLQLNFKLDYEPERNYNQSQKYSADIVSVKGWCIEVKRRESLDLDSWWLQVVFASRRTGEMPVVAFRQNRKSWEFLVSAGAVGLDKGYIRMSERIFKEYAKVVMKGHAVGNRLNDTTE